MSYAFATTPFVAQSLFVKGALSSNGIWASGSKSVAALRAGVQVGPKAPFRLGRASQLMRGFVTMTP